MEKFPGVEATDPVFDLAAASRTVREEVLIAETLVMLARRSFRGQHIPRRVRRLMADAQRVASAARDHARTLDDMLAVLSQRPPWKA